MEYTLRLNEEERNLLMVDLYEMTKQEEFYDKELAQKVLYKMFYAERTQGTGKHFTEE